MDLRNTISFTSIFSVCPICDSDNSHYFILCLELGVRYYTLLMMLLDAWRKPESLW